jgi:hypothetical protein
MLFSQREAGSDDTVRRFYVQPYNNSYERAWDYHHSVWWSLVRVDRICLQET